MTTYKGLMLYQFVMGVGSGMEKLSGGVTGPGP